MRGQVVILLLSAAALLAVPAVRAERPAVRGRAAAVCADYSNQAAAQHAGDTRDGDGDGIYCEDLPCPCAKPGTGGGGSHGGGGDRPARPPRRHTAHRMRGRITRVVDGDTIHVRLRGGRDETVRLIGIDTPEEYKPGVPVECGAEAAARHLRRLAVRHGRGLAVRLTTDRSQDTYDRYGRLLAYVTTYRGHRRLNLRQVASGWAEVYVYEGRPFRRYRRFHRAERRAERHHRGVWRRCGGDFHSEQ